MWRHIVSFSSRNLAPSTRFSLAGTTTTFQTAPRHHLRRPFSSKAAKAMLTKHKAPSTASTNKNEKLLQPPDPAKEDEIRQLQFEVRTHHQNGNYSEALKSSVTLLKVTQDHFGKDHPASASSYNNVGLMYKLLGQYEQSRVNYHEALRIYERVLGKDHASYAAALHNLGNLNRSQLHLDESLSAMDRLQLNEEAMSYLEEAWVIRQAELGDEHPHTVASRSNLGSAMAAQVLQIQSQQLEQQKKEWKADDDKQSASPRVSKPSKFTMKRWEAAEEHLRAALQTAIQNPRGSQMTAATDNERSSICTLSAASAAQNLAVFLKSRATVQQPQTDEDALYEAKQLYQQVLRVRSELLHETHPDTVATKFSLAELLAVLGDEDGANKIREEILESHGDVIMGKDAAAMSSSRSDGGGKGRDSGQSESSKPSKK